MKDFMVTMAGIMVGSLLFVLILGSSPGTVSLRSETGSVMKSVVNQMNHIIP